MPLPRLYKAVSPTRNWIHGSSRGRLLPPQYPRRGSNLVPLPVVPNSAAKSNRSRSLDGLLDSSSSETSGPTAMQAASGAAAATPIPSASQSCDELDVKSSSSDKVSLYSDSSGDSKRKRNFMDRCVNKVRSLIKK